MLKNCLSFLESNTEVILKVQRSGAQLFFGIQTFLFLSHANENVSNIVL